MGFAKIHREIEISSINEEALEVRWFWVILLANADEHGNVNGTIGALARKANIPMDGAAAAIEILTSPDPNSTTKTDDGRRLAKMDGNVWHVVNHEQYRDRELYDRKKEQSRKTSQTYRDKRRAGADGDASVTDGDADVMPYREQRTENREQKTENRIGSSDDPLSPPEPADKPTKKKRPPFKPPTVAEVQAYIDEKGLQVDAAGFIDFYESKGWMVGKTPMRSWPAACRRAQDWERNKRLASKNAVKSRKLACKTTRLDQLNDEDAHELRCRWRTASEGARTQMDPEDFKSFVEPLAVIGQSADGFVVVGCSNSIVVDWVNDYLFKDLPESVIAVVED